MTTPDTTTKRTRLSLDLDQRAKAQLELVATRTSSASLTETVKRAVSLYDLVTEHTAAGGTLVFRRADGTEEVLRIL